MSHPFGGGSSGQVNTGGGSSGQVNTGGGASIHGGWSGQYYSGAHTSALYAALGWNTDIQRETLIERLVARRRAPGEEAVAAGCAGGPSNFNLNTVRSNPSVSWPEPPNPDADAVCDNPLVYTIETWTCHVDEVPNDDDPSLVYEVLRFDTMCFKTAEGRLVQLDMTKAWQTIEALIADGESPCQ